MYHGPPDWVTTYPGSDEVTNYPGPDWVITYPGPDWVTTYPGPDQTHSSERVWKVILMYPINQPLSPPFK